MGPPAKSENGARVPRAALAPALDPGDLTRLVSIGVFALVTLLVVTVDWDSPIRVALTIAFLLFGPGLALAELLAIDDPVQRLALAPAASLALETLVSAVLFYAGLFSIGAACGIVVALTCVALLAAAWRRSFGDQALAAEDARGAAT